MKKNFAGVEVRCHNENGPYWLATHRPTEILTLDTCGDLIRPTKKLMWWLAPSDLNYLDMEGVYTPVYIVGKGPSLDNVTKKTFEEKLPILCCNDSIHHIVSLDLVNPIYGVVCDRKFKDNQTIKPRIIDVTCYENFQFQKDILWTYPKDLNASGFFHVGHMATLLAVEKFKCTEIRYIGFDGAFGGDCSYAKVIGYKETRKGPAFRFSKHGKNLIAAAGNTPYKVIMLKTPHEQSFVDIPPPSQDNPQEQYEEPDSESHIENTDISD